MEPGYLVLAVIAFVVFKVWLKKQKRKREYELLNNVNYSARRPGIRKKPKNGRRRTPEEMLRDHDAEMKRAGNSSRKIAKDTRLKAERVGSPGYIWHASGDGLCEYCAKNDGKEFKWNKPPKTGHPGEGHLCKNKHCKCWAEVIIPPPGR
jgi:hypothetical protein